MSAPERGYADGPIIKPAVWTWEVPVYFFVGGSAGMAGLIAGVVFLLADARGELEAALPLVSRALWIAFAGAVLSPPLLISDLGRPRRFLNMLRRFNRTSALSVGVWILIAFSGAVTAALWLHGARLVWPSWPGSPASFHGLLAPLLGCVAILGGLLATYTGVLVAATVVPAWNRHRALLPVHFGLASLAAASAWLVLLGSGGAAVVRLMLAALVLDALIELLMARSDRSAGSPHAQSVLAVMWMPVVAAVTASTGLVWIAALIVLAMSLNGRFAWVRRGTRLKTAADPVSR